MIFFQRSLVVFLFLLSSAVLAIGSPSLPIAVAAEYYYSRHDYHQALELWSEVVKKQPGEIYPLLRVADIKLMLEGKRVAQELLLSAMRAISDQIDGYSRSVISQRLTQILSTFVSDEAQSLYLQAKPKLNFNDREGALRLLSQAFAIEPENLLVLRKKAYCESVLGQKEAYLSTVRTFFALNPFDPGLSSEFLKALYESKKFSEIVTTLPVDLVLASDEDSILFFVSALVEMKADSEALVILDELSKKTLPKKQGEEKLPTRKSLRNPNLLVHFLRAKVFSRYDNLRRDESRELERFLQITQTLKSTQVNPIFEIEAKAEEAKKRLLLISSLERS